MPRPSTSLGVGTAQPVRTVYGLLVGRHLRLDSKPAASIRSHMAGRSPSADTRNGHCAEARPQRRRPQRRFCNDARASDSRTRQHRSTLQATCTVQQRGRWRPAALMGTSHAGPLCDCEPECEMDAELVVELNALAPRSKWARLLPLLPLIESKLGEGITVDEIAAALQRGGLPLTAATLRNYLARYRRQQRAGQYGQRRETDRQSKLPVSDTLSAASRPAALPPPRHAGRTAPSCPAEVQVDALDRYERLGRALSRRQRQPRE